MKHRLALLSIISAAAMILGGCSKQDTSAEIKIPIIDGNAMGSYTTAAAERADMCEYTTVGGDVTYPYADTVTVPADANLLSYNVKKGDVLQKGDVIAVFDSSSLDYDYQNQKILTDNALARYQSTGSALAKAEYEIEAGKLELIEYKRDCYTIRAPYDCVVWDSKFHEAGTAMEAGAPLCTIANKDEVYVVVKGSNDAFALGRHVTMKFGTNGEFTGRVVMMPDSRGKNGINGVVIALDEGELEKANEEAGSIVSAGWATVVVKTYNDPHALCVPDKAVQTYSGNTYCYLDSGGSRIRVPVEAGKSVGGMTVILSGLSEGDVVSY